MEFGTGRRVFQPIEHHHHIGKIAHKFARNLSDRERRSAVHANRAALRIKRSDFFRTLAAPRLRVAPGELC